MSVTLPFPVGILPFANQFEPFYTINRIRFRYSHCITQYVIAGAVTQTLAFSGRIVRNERIFMFFFSSDIDKNPKKVKVFRTELANLNNRGRTPNHTRLGSRSVESRCAFPPAINTYRTRRYNNTLSFRRKHGETGCTKTLRCGSIAIQLTATTIRPPDMITRRYKRVRYWPSIRSRVCSRIRTRRGNKK